MLSKRSQILGLVLLGSYIPSFFMDFVPEQWAITGIILLATFISVLIDTLLGD